jgi:hypothetical protein
MCRPEGRRYLSTPDPWEVGAASRVCAAVLLLEVYGTVSKAALALGSVKV